jgi:hypothetical protein
MNHKTKTPRKLYFLRTFTTVVSSENPSWLLRPEHIIPHTEAAIMQLRIPMCVLLNDKPFDQADNKTHPKLFLVLESGSEIEVYVDDAYDIELYDDIRDRYAGADITDPAKIMEVQNTLTSELSDAHLESDSRLESSLNAGVNHLGSWVVSQTDVCGSSGLSTKKLVRRSISVSDIVSLFISQRLYPTHEFRMFPKWYSTEWFNNTDPLPSLLLNTFPEVWTEDQDRVVLEHTYPEIINHFNQAMEPVEVPCFLERSYCGYVFGNEQYTGAPWLMRERLLEHCGKDPVMLYGRALYLDGPDSDAQQHHSKLSPWCTFNTLWQPQTMNGDDTEAPPVHQHTRMRVLTQDFQMESLRVQNSKMDSRAYNTCVRYMGS